MSTTLNCPSLGSAPGFCAMGLEELMGGMNNGGYAGNLPGWIAYQQQVNWTDMCQEWQTEQLSCINAIATGSSSPYLQDPAAIDAAVEAQLFPTGTANTTGVESPTNPASTLPASNPVTTPPAASNVVSGTPGASVGTAPAAVSSGCFNPLNAYVSDSCMGPMGIFEWGIVAALALWALWPKGR